VASGTVFNGSNAFAFTVGDDLVAQMRIPPKIRSTLPRVRL